MTVPYRFPGVSAADVPPGLRPDYAAKIPGNWLVCRAVDALAQCAEAPPDHREGILRAALDARAAVAATLAVLDAKIAEVRRECFPPEEPAPPDGSADAPDDPPRRKHRKGA